MSPHRDGISSPWCPHSYPTTQLTMVLGNLQLTAMLPCSQPLIAQDVLHSSGPSLGDGIEEGLQRRLHEVLQVKRSWCSAWSMVSAHWRLASPTMALRWGEDVASREGYSVFSVGQHLRHNERWRIRQMERASSSITSPDASAGLRGILGIG